MISSTVCAYTPGGMRCYFFNCFNTAKGDCVCSTSQLHCSSLSDTPHRGHNPLQFLSQSNLNGRERISCSASTSSTSISGSSRKTVSIFSSLSSTSCCESMLSSSSLKIYSKGSSISTSTGTPQRPQEACTSAWICPSSTAVMSSLSRRTISAWGALRKSNPERLDHPVSATTLRSPPAVISLHGIFTPSTFEFHRPRTERRNEQK